MNPGILLAAFLTLACAALPQVFAADYCVSVTGSNGNAGTPAAPWRDIQFGVDQAGPGDRVLVRNGTYHEAVQIAVSGTTSARITLAAENGHAPIIDGTGLNGGINHNGNTILGGIVIINQSHLTVRGFEIRDFQGTGGNFPAGIWVRGGCKKITIEDNTVHDNVTYNVDTLSNPVYGGERSADFRLPSP